MPQAAALGEKVRYVDPLAAIKRKVHQSLLDALGPTLYDAELDESELAAASVRRCSRSWSPSRP